MLVLKKVSARYGPSQVLWDLDMEANTGEGVAVLGRNGAGKTTLLRTVMGLHPAAGGAVEFFSNEITGLPAFERARMGIAYVPQGRGIFPHLTGKENLLMGMAALDAKRPVKAEEVLEPVLRLFPGMPEFLNRRGGNLSGGQQQQLAIARALVMKPRLILLDEPTEGLQPSIVSDIEQALTEIRLKMKITVVIVEQHIELAWNFATRYYVMQKGRIVKTGMTREENQSAVTELLSV